MDFQRNIINMSQKPNFIRLIVILLWSVLASIHVQQLYAEDIDCTTDGNACRVKDPAPECGCNQYLEVSEGDRVCRDCVNCCSQGQVVMEPCTTYHNTECYSCVSGAQYYDLEKSKCENCTVCKEDEQKVADCSISENTRCQPRCQPHQYFRQGQCYLDCAQCQNGCVTSGTARCRCQPSRCYHDTDILCDNNICATTGTTPLEVTGTVADESNELPTWGIGLISIGVVIGIVAFSAGSMILGFCTRRTSQVEEDAEGGGNPNPSLVGRYGQPSPFLHHDALHLIDNNRSRCSPNSVRTNSRNGSLRINGVRNSPKALRSMPAPRVENGTPI